MNKKINVGIAVLFSVVLTSCWYNHKWEDMHPNGQSSGPPVPCDTAGVISYSATIQPIITSNCATTSACHISHGGALDYNSFSNLVADCQAGPPNDVMSRMDLPTTNSLHMPQGGSFLQTCDTLKIKKWIIQGCLNN